MTTILIVDDEELVRDLLEAILKPEYDLLQAATATQAKALARLNRPDLILLDINLHSSSDGLEVCRTLRGDSDPIVAQVPIVMLTGGTREADIKLALSAGANSYIAKPFNTDSLLAVIATLLSRRRT